MKKESVKRKLYEYISLTKKKKKREKNTNKKKTWTSLIRYKIH